MDYANLLIEIADGVAVVTINRPTALNALNAAVLHELDAAIEELKEDAKVACLILTGSGAKAFVAGADIAAMQPLDAVTAATFARLGHRVLSASETARFGQPEVNLGVIPGFGGTLRLARLVGKGRAKELIFTGDMIDAQEAYRIGLANKVVTAEELLPTARKMAAKIASKGPIAVRYAKESVDAGLEMDIDRAARFEADLFGLCFATSDQKEGMLAFLEKRPAQFKGN